MSRGELLADYRCKRIDTFRLTGDIRAFSPLHFVHALAPPAIHGRFADEVNCNYRRPLHEYQSPLYLLGFHVGHTVQWAILETRKNNCGNESLPFNSARRRESDEIIFFCCGEQHGQRRIV